MASSCQILLIEDDPDHAELILSTLHQCIDAERVEHASDGSAALERLTKLHEARNFPQLILLDLRLPRIDGIQVLQAIKSRQDWRTTPVVILTTSDEDADIRRAYDNGANSYLVKPFDYGEFCKLVAELNLYWLGHNRTLAV